MGDTASFAKSPEPESEDNIQPSVHQSRLATEKQNIHVSNSGSDRTILYDDAFKQTM